LKEKFLNHPDVTELSAVESARVPIMSFDFERVSIDLLFARLVDDVVPNKLDVLDDRYILHTGLSDSSSSHFMLSCENRLPFCRILSGLDDVTVTTLNGPRVTMMIPELVGKEAYPNFLIVLRCVRKWAKERGLYGNKHGYLGGINCNLLVVFICQLFPNASPSTLLARFFQVFGSWKWSHMNPVQVNKIQPNPPNLYGEQRDVWSPENNPNHVMPIITPAYPAMNSSANVTIHTRDIMQQEMQRAHEIIKTIIEERGENWGRLFEPSDFYLRYPHYLCCQIIGDGDDEDSRSWIGYVESRVGRLSQSLERLPLKHPIHFFPRYSKSNKGGSSICYFIGFHLDHNHRLIQRGDKDIHIDSAVAEFT
jgi:poly(A) polymerase